MKPNLNIPKIHVNAEFQRLWWLNASWAMMAGLVLVYALFLGMKSEHVALSVQLLAVGASGMGFSVFAIGFLIERSVRRDVDMNMFDQLRMCSLSAWQMTYSRLLVAPMVAWFAFAIGWVMYVFGAMGEGVAVNNVLYIISAPCTAWALACVALCNAIERRQHQEYWSGSFVQMVLFAVMMILFMTEFTASEIMRLKASNYYSLLDMLFEVMAIDVVDGNGLKVLSSNLLLAALATIGVHAIMAQRLHLKSAHTTLLCLAFVLPFTLWWAMAVDKYITVYLLAMCYGGVSLLSLVTQNSALIDLKRGFAQCKQGDFRLPVWVILLPVGAMCAWWFSLNAFWVYAKVLIVFAVLVVGLSSFRLRYNSITVAMMVYLLMRILFAF